MFLSLRRYDPDQVRRVAAPHLLGPAASQPPVGAPLGLVNYPQTASCTSRPKEPDRPKRPKLGAEVGSGHKDREFLPSLIDASTLVAKISVRHSTLFVVPAQEAVKKFCGQTIRRPRASGDPGGKRLKSLGSRFRGNDEQRAQRWDMRNWITAAQAGTQRLPLA